MGRVYCLIILIRSGGRQGKIKEDDTEYETLEKVYLVMHLEYFVGGTNHSGTCIWEVQ